MTNSHNKPSPNQQLVNTHSRQFSYEDLRFLLPLAYYYRTYTGNLPVRVINALDSLDEFLKPLEGKND